MPPTPPDPSNPPARLALCLPTVLFAAGLGAAGFGGPAAAELYRWVDETGATVYSQGRPSGEVRATVIETPKPGPAAGQSHPAAKGRDRAAIEREFDQREEQKRLAEVARKEAEAAAAKAKAQANRELTCENSRKNLETLQDHGRGRLRMPDGTLRFLSRDELATMQKETQDLIRDNCD
jgi:hypothetical protein